MTRSGKIARGLLVHYAGQVLVVLVGLWTTRFVLERLGLLPFGYWSLGLSLLGYLALADLGVIAMLNREIGRLRGQHPDDPSFARDYVSRSLKLSAGMVPLLAAVALGLWLAIPGEWQPLEGPLAVLLIGFVLLSPMRVFATALGGAQDHAAGGLIVLAGWACGTAATLLLLLADAGLYSLACGWIVQASTTAAVAAGRLKLRHPELFPALGTRLRGPWLKPMLTAGLWQSLNSAAVTLFSAADAFVLAIVLGPEIVASFALSMKLLQMLGNYATAALQLSLPAFAEARERLSPAQIAAACQALLLGQLTLSAFVGVVVVATNGGFLRLWLNRTEADLGPGFIGLAAFSLVLRHLNAATSFTLFTLGFNRRIAFSNLLDGVLSVGAMALLVPWLGPVGAPAASATVLLLVMLPWNLRTIARELGTRVFTLIRPGAVLARIALPAALAAVSAVWVLPHFVDKLPLLGMLVAITLALAALYWVCVFGLLRNTIFGAKFEAVLIRMRRAGRIFSASTGGPQ